MAENSIRMDMNQVETRQSSLRQTPNTSFGEQFKSGLAQTASVVGNTAAGAGYAIPGASVVGAAINSLGQVRDQRSFSAMSPTAGSLGSTGTSSSLGSGALGGGGSLSSPTLTATGTTSGVGGTSSTGGSSSQSLLDATQQMTELNQTFNLQYLQLQENMQQESREFTAMSNVMKAKSDTAKNSLSNLK
jgi:hypothetical protein